MKIGDLVKITEPQHKAEGKLGVILETKTSWQAPFYDKKKVKKVSVINCFKVLVGNKEEHVIPNCLEIVSES